VDKENLFAVGGTAPAAVRIDALDYSDRAIAHDRAYTRAQLVWLRARASIGWTHEGFPGGENSIMRVSSQVLEDLRGELVSEDQILRLVALIDTCLAHLIS
jgi:hypothetical protein